MLKDLSLVWEDARHEQGCFQHIEQTTAFGRKLTIISQDGWGPPTIWDLDHRRLLFRGKSPSSHSWLFALKGETILANQMSGAFRVQRLVLQDSGEQPSLTAVDFGSPVEIEGKRFSGIIRLQGRRIVLSAVQDHVRLWDFEDLITEAKDKPSGESAPQEPNAIPPIASLAVMPTRAGDLYMGLHKEIVALDAATGDMRWRRALGANELACALATSSERDWLIAGTDNGSIYILDAGLDGALLRVIKAADDLERLRVVEWRGCCLAFATVSSRGTWALRIWNLDSGQEVPTNSKYQLHTGEKDKRLHGLALSRTDQTVRFAFASKYGKIMVSNFDEPVDKNRQRYREFDEWRVPNTWEEYVECLVESGDVKEIFLAAGTEYGHLAIWNFLSGAEMASRADAHLDRIGALCFGSIGEELVLVSGALDGVLRFWTTGLQPLFEVEIGDRINAIAWIRERRLAVCCSRGALLLELGPSDHSPVTEPRTYSHGT